MFFLYAMDSNDARSVNLDDEHVIIISDQDYEDEEFNNRGQVNQLIGEREQQQYAAEDLAAIQTPAEPNIFGHSAPPRTSSPISENAETLRHSNGPYQDIYEIRAEPVVLIERIAGEEVPSPEPASDRTRHFSILNGDDGPAPQPVLATPQPVLVSPRPVLAAAQLLLAASQPVLAAPQPTLATSRPVLAASQLLLAASQSVLAAPQPMLATSQPVLAASQTVLPAPQPVLPAIENDQNRKRKRLSKNQSPEEQKKSAEQKVEDPDDGSICPICLDNWEMSGLHRLTSLKCGHLFGQSCIKRWIQSCTTNGKVCPTCKSKATIRDLRFIYAKRVCAIDKSEEYRLRDLLQLEKVENSSLVQTVQMLRCELAMSKQKLSQVEGRLEQLEKHGDSIGSSTSTFVKLYRYKLAKDKVYELAKDAGSRVMLSGRISPTLAISQKSSQSLFPGYGIRILDVNTFRSTSFLHMSSKPVRDLSYSTNEQLIASATLEKCVKLFNVHDRTVINTFVPSDKPIWACALDTEAKSFVYLGSGHGSTYIYDIRNTEQMVEEFKNVHDTSPVIAIAAVFSSVAFPFGGFLVCKLKSLWFHEYMASQEVMSTRLNVDGPFVSMSYDSTANSLLIATRWSKQFSARYIVSKLVKLNEMAVLDTLATFEGSKVAPIMSRSTQVIMANATLISAYLQDRKMLGLWNLNDKYRTQSLPISDIVYDTCPIYDGDTTHVAALTENKCRFYRVIPDGC